MMLEHSSIISEVSGGTYLLSKRNSADPGMFSSIKSV